LLPLSPVCTPFQKGEVVQVQAEPFPLFFKEELGEILNAALSTHLRM
jgi:hypothetical protein